MKLYVDDSQYWQGSRQVFLSNHFRVMMRVISLRKRALTNVHWPVDSKPGLR